MSGSPLVLKERKRTVSRVRVDELVAAVLPARERDHLALLQLAPPARRAQARPAGRRTTTSSSSVKVMVVGVGCFAGRNLPQAEPQLLAPAWRLRRARDARKPGFSRSSSNSGSLRFGTPPSTPIAGLTPTSFGEVRAREAVEARASHASAIPSSGGQRYALESHEDRRVPVEVRRREEDVRLVGQQRLLGAEVLHARPRIGPSGAPSPSASISFSRRGRSQTNSLSLTRH